MQVAQLSKCVCDAVLNKKTKKLLGLLLTSAYECLKISVCPLCHDVTHSSS